MATALTTKEARIKDEATAFAKKHKKEIAKRLTDPKIYPPEEKPVSVFMASYEVAEKNIKRSLKRDRLVQILYVYQDPPQAWQFVLAREEQEGRRIRRQDFIEQYFAARENVNKLKQQFKKKVSVDLLVKNNDGSQRAYKANVAQIDSHVPEKYAPADLEALLEDPHTSLL